MAKTARLAEVARLAGVSPGLVSRMLNGDPTLKIRPETRERVNSAVELLRYSPHASARALRNSQTGLLGFALHHVNDPVYASMVDAAEAAAEAQDYSVMLLNAPVDSAPTQTFKRVVRGRRIDGLLVQGGYAQDSALLQDAQLVPSVLFDSDAVAGFRTIRLDDAEASAVATRHLIELGHRNIVFAGADGASSARRYQGYSDAMGEARLAVPPPLTVGWDVDEARLATEQRFRQGNVPTALVVVTAAVAFGVHAGILAAGHSIPDDVSVVTIHDTWFTPHLTPSLTAVSLPLPELGRAAVEMLIAQLQSPAEGETVIREPAPHLIPRASTARAIH